MAVDKYSAPGTKGRVLHSPVAYDLLAWLLLLGKERAFRDRLVDLAGVQPDQSVLDVGCGTGSLAMAAKRRVGPGGSVQGVDASVEMIARAKKRARKAALDVTFETGVVEALPYPNGRFDVVLSTLMLHHLPRAARELCAREIRRVLKPGGRALVVDFGQSGTHKGLIEHIHRRHGAVPPREIIDLLGGAGLQVMESGAVGVRDLNFVLASA